MLRHITTAVIFVLMSATAALSQEYQRQRIDLRGEWETNLGKATLPGTTDTNHLGEGCTDTTQTHALTRLYPHVGRLSYGRTIILPKAMAGGELRLIAERTKPSTLYIDGDSIGSLGHLYSPHIYNIAGLSEGEHRIEIEIDNTPTALPHELFGSHALTDATQTNWNGILGDIYIERLPSTRIEQIEIYPDIDNNQATIQLRIHSQQAQQSTIICNIESWNCDNPTPEIRLKKRTTLKAGDNSLEWVIDMGDDVRLWSEFHPALYRCTIELNVRGGIDVASTNFGMRLIESRDGALWLNKRRIFLRGKHDAAVFPLTGYPPMETESWIEYFKKLKEYGINHIRCHSYTPPKAAFEAADIVGIYIQTELPLWGSITRENTQLNDFLYREAEMTLPWIGNHPSFAIFALGNELNGEVGIMSEMIDSFKAKDSRHLYAMGANNFLGWQGPQQGEDVYVACRNGWGELYDSHLRSSFAFVDAEQGGAINGLRPSTRGDYSKAIANIGVPVVGHETGQFQIYPDYAEIESYKGVLHPYNLKTFRRKLHSRSMTHLAREFQQATGHFAVECYKADVEYALRTAGMDGYQILDIQDYPGQGTALVGILTATMQSKGIVEPERWRQWCSEIVPLASFDSYCIEAGKSLDVEIMVFNYSEKPLHKPLRWELSAEGKEICRTGEIASTAEQGELSDIGSIEIEMPHSNTPYTATLTLTIADHENSYRLWVYPSLPTPAPSELLRSQELTRELYDKVEQGATLLLSPQHDTIEENSVGGLFTPDYWNYSMFKSISEGAKKPVSPGTLGILCDPEHPVFELFPTEAHSDWQWWCIARNSRPLILDNTSAQIEPIVQVVDNIERCHRLGILFEFRVGEGKIILSTTDMKAIEPYIEGRWWQRAIEEYALSKRCSPTTTITYEQLHTLLYGKQHKEQIEGVRNISDYSSPEL